VHGVLADYPRGGGLRGRVVRRRRQLAAQSTTSAPSFIGTLPKTIRHFMAAMHDEVGGIPVTL
jgi:hypothetical protein